MPSDAQLEGERIIASLLARGQERPPVTIRARRVAGPDAIAFTFRRPMNGADGEYDVTYVLGNDGDRETTLAMMARRVARHHEVDRMIDAARAESEACDHDPLADVHCDDDMAIPAWRTHAPAAVRRALDALGVDAAERNRMLEETGVVERDGARITFDDVQDAATRIAVAEARGMVPTRSVRRATISQGGALWTQGITTSRLRMGSPLPSATVAALIGRNPGDLVDLPGMDAPGLVIVAAHPRTDRVDFDVTRVHAMLAPTPGETP